MGVGIDTIDSTALVAVQGNLTAHTNLTGASVHGLGSASILTAGATGGSMVTATTVDVARGVIGLPSEVLPPLIRYHNNIAFTATNVVGSATFASYFDSSVVLFSYTVPNSSGSYIINDDAISWNYTDTAINWGKRLDLNVFVKPGSNAEGVLYWTIGKQTNYGYGLTASGNYVGFKIENQTLTGLIYCVAGTVTVIAVSATAVSLQMYITSNNGSISWYANGVLMGSTSSGPTVNAYGTIFAEIQNGGTAAMYAAAITSSSTGY